METILHIKRQYNLKLPDAIIAGTAIFSQAILITADKDFRKVKELEVSSF
ncbi:MAG: PIN domain-containing protein [SAR324 cluster bacterium]|nr:PIN domain-containing protein [SAR324 cluster bacterium]